MPTATGAARRVLVIGPSPHTDSGARISFELLLGYLQGQAGLAVSHYDLPVHRPLYQDDGTPGPLCQGATLRRALAALRQLPRHDAVLLFGTVDLCFTYGLAFVLGAALFRKHCAMRITGGRARFSTDKVPRLVRPVCFSIARLVAVISIQTEIAREDLPALLQGKLAPVRGYRPGPAVRRAARRRGRRMRLAFVIRADPAKGEAVLGDALARLDDHADRLELHVYGRPLALGQAFAGVPTTLHGYLPNDRLRQALAGSDVLLFPSCYPFEGHPGVVIEAFMAGVPVIATDLPGPREIVEHGVNGLIVPVGDAPALASAMRQLASDEYLRERLARGALASGRRFDQARVVPELVATLGLLPQHRVG